MLASPNLYNGKLVRVHGAVVVRFEANMICATADDIDSGYSNSIEKCLWLGRPFAGSGLSEAAFSRLHKKYVDLLGTFNSHHHGHGGAYGGEIVVLSARITGTHGKGDVPPPPPEPSSVRKGQVPRI